jgi:hypothetical protein
MVLYNHKNILSSLKTCQIFPKQYEFYNKIFKIQIAKKTQKFHKILQKFNNRIKFRIIYQTRKHVSENVIYS